MEQEPRLPPWSGPDNPVGPGHLRGGTLFATVRLSAVPAEFLPEALQSIDPDQPITATLGRPHRGGLHDRVVWRQRPATSWRDVLPGAESCNLFEGPTCVRLGTRVAAVTVEGDRVQLDVFSDPVGGTATALEVSPPPADLGLTGDVVAHSHAARIRPELKLPTPPAIEETSLELTAAEGHVDARLRWRLASGPAGESSAAPAPSWHALCAGAAACFRTGPWPDALAWLSRLAPAKLSSVYPDSPLDLARSAWPHVLASTILDLRGTLPTAAAGMFDNALAGLAEVGFSGGRLEADGTFLAYLRLPSPWVNYTASVLAFVGRTPSTTVLSDGTEVSWSALPRGGVVLALDDGVEPAMGWIAFTSSAERFTWLANAPQTQAGPSALALRVEHLVALRQHAPAFMLGWIDAHAQDPFVFHLGSEDGLLTARVMLGDPPG